MLKIECKDNYVISLIRANFGRFSIAVCNEFGSTDWSVNCISHRSFSILQGRCGSKQNCSVAASTSLFDDPCPGTVKYLEAHYVCVPAISSSTPRPPWLQTNSPGIWTTSKSFTLHSETTTTATSPTTAATPPPTKAVPKEPEDWPPRNTPPSTAQSPAEPKTTVSAFANEEISNDGVPLVPDEKVPMCTPIVARNLTWPSISGGKVWVQPCPDGAVGSAQWRCQAISDTLAIRFPETPDLSECRSTWLNSLRGRIQEQHSSLINIASDLCRVIKSKPIFGGDILTTVDIIRRLSREMQKNTFPDNLQRESMVDELLQSAAYVSNDLLDESQRVSWKDLSYKEQINAASTLLVGLEENSFLLAKTVTHSTSVRHCLKNLLLSVQVLETKNVGNERFPTDSVLDGCPFGSDSWLQLQKSSLLENSNNGLVRLSYTIFNTLDQVLKVPPNSKEGKIINSKVISASLGDGRHIQLAQPVTLCLRHLRTENVTNPRCVFWDYSQNLWSEEGCSLVTTNETHTTCRCLHLTNFAIMVDVQPTISGLIAQPVSVVTLVLSLLLVLVLLSISAILVVRHLRKQHSRKQYGGAAFTPSQSKWLSQCLGCCQQTDDSEKPCKEPRSTLYSNAAMQSMASVVNNSGGTVCATRIVPHMPNTLPQSYMVEDTMEDRYPRGHSKLNHHYPTYGRNSSVRKMREARHLEHLENTLQQRNKKLMAGSQRSSSPRSHTYSEIAATSQRSDPVYEEIERGPEHCAQISDISDEEAKRISDTSRQSSRSYGDHRPLIPYNAVTDRNFHAALDAAYRHQLMEHNARTVSVLDGQTVVCHLQQSDPRIYHKSTGHVSPHGYQ